MLGKGLLTDSDGNTLTNESEEVKKYFATEEFRLTQIDEDLFVYLYDQLCNLGDLTEEKGWVKYHDEADKRTFYK